MNPDSWMPLYGNDLFAAIEGLPDHIGLGYMKAIWHYWHHTHCAGLPDNDEYLRKVCRIEKDQWDDARGVIFDATGNLFSLGEDGKWHQKRCSLEWHKAVEKYNKVTERAKDAAAARWGARGPRKIGGRR